MKRLILLALLLLIGVSLAGCNNTTEKTITEVSFDSSILAESYNIDDFSIDDYELTVIFSDGSKSIVPINENMISTSELLKLRNNGVQTIEVLYQGFKVSITITFTGDSSFTIKWKNTDGSILETNQVEYGTLPTYDGVTPTKVGTSQYDYTFTGWSSIIGLATSDLEYTAQFSEKIKEYEVLWKNHDGSILETNQVEYGSLPIYEGATPTKVATAEYTYIFDGWSSSVEEVNGNQEYIALFTNTINEYSITWKNEDETVLKTTQLAYGETPIFDGIVPIKESTQEYSYDFDGWTPNVGLVTENQTYTALMDAKKQVYVISIDTNGGTLENTELSFEYGTEVDNLETPRKQGYEFIGWIIDDQEMELPYILVDNIQIIASYRELQPHELIWDYYANISPSDKVIVNNIEGYIELLSDDSSTIVIYYKEGAYGFYYDSYGYEFTMIMDLVNSKFYYFDQSDYNYERDFLYKSNSGNVSKEDYLLIEEMFVDLKEEFEDGILITLSETYGKIIEVSDFNEAWDELVLLPDNRYMTYEMYVMENIEVGLIVPGYTPYDSFARFDYYVMNNSVETINYLKIKFEFYEETVDGYVVVHEEIITYYTYLVPNDFDDKTMYTLLSKLQDENGYSIVDFMMITVLDLSF